MQTTFNNLGILVTDFVPDGTIKRVPTLTNAKSLNGWYSAKIIDNHTYCVAGNWATGQQERYCSTEEVTPEITNNWAVLAEIARKEQEKKNKEARDRAIKVLADAPKLLEHAYLTKKSVKPYGDVRQYYDKMLVPVMNDNKVAGYQTIKDNGDKKFLTGTAMKGSYFIIKGEKNPIYLAEGYATGATIHEATGNTVICCFNASNIVNVAKQLEGQELIVCADFDKISEHHKLEGGAGIHYAKKTGLPYKYPTSIGDFNDIGVEATRQILKPTAVAYIPEEARTNQQVLFPSDSIYDGAPDVYKRVYDEWMDSVVEPIGGFAFATIESAMQVLCGKNVLTPGHARTVVTFSLCGSHSGAGKDLSSKNPLRKLREQLIKSAPGVESMLFEKLTTGIGSITGDTAFLGQAKDTDGGFLWLTTEASELLRQLSTNSSMANQGSSLATALNDSYDGHEITGKRKAGGSIDSVNYPNIPICWLTQLKELKRQLTPELLEIGTLGRFDYILDYNPEKATRSSFEGGLVVGMDASQAEILKASRGFSDRTIAMIIKAVGNIFEGQVAWREDAYKYIMEYDIALKEKYDSTDGIGKFLCRTSMSVEKRLTAWVAMDGRNVIELSDVKGMMKWYEYQTSMREQVYNREIKKDSDLLIAIKDTIAKIYMQGSGIVTCRSSGKSEQYKKLISKGIVSRADFYAKFNKEYGDSFQKYVERTAINRELDAYIKEGDLCEGQQQGFKATTGFLWIPEN